MGHGFQFAKVLGYTGGKCKNRDKSNTYWGMEPIDIGETWWMSSFDMRYVSLFARACEEATLGVFRSTSNL